VNVKTILGFIARVVKAGRRAKRRLRSAAWYRAERVALWIMARSALRIETSYRTSRLRHWAYQKGAVVRLGSWLGSNN
jgi:hypothetical protein